jgi:hypothetical protein
LVDRLDQLGLIWKKGTQAPNQITGKSSWLMWILRRGRIEEEEDSVSKPASAQSQQSVSNMTDSTTSPVNDAEVNGKIDNSTPQPGHFTIPKALFEIFNDDISGIQDLYNKPDKCTSHPTNVGGVLRPLEAFHYASAFAPKCNLILGDEHKNPERSLCVIDISTCGDKNYSTCHYECIGALIKSFNAIVCKDGADDLPNNTVSDVVTDLTSDIDSTEVATVADDSTKLAVTTKPKIKREVRIFYSNCVLEHYREGTGRYILVDILRTLCSEPLIHFSIYDRKRKNVQIYNLDEELRSEAGLKGSTTLHKFRLEFLCRPDIVIDQATFTDYMNCREIHYTQRKLFYDPTDKEAMTKRGVARDVSDPEAEVQFFRNLPDIEKTNAQWVVRRGPANSLRALTTDEGKSSVVHLLNVILSVSLQLKGLFNMHNSSI